MKGLIEDNTESYNKDIEEMKRLVNDSGIDSWKDDGDLAEKYILCILKKIYGANVGKIPEGEFPTPDYLLKFNFSEIKIENKMLEQQVPFHQIFTDMYSNESSLDNNLQIDCFPANINFKDVESFRMQLFEWVKDGCPNDLLNVSLNKGYVLKVLSRSSSSTIFSGSCKNIGGPFYNVIGKKQDQLKNANYLSLVILNKFFYGEELFKVFYPICNDLTGDGMVLNYSYNPWEKIIHLEGVFVFYPKESEVVFLENPSSGEFNEDFLESFKEGIGDAGYSFDRINYKKYGAVDKVKI